MLYKIIKTQLIVLVLTNCSSSVKFVKSHTGSQLCFPEYITKSDRKYQTCNIGYKHAMIHPYYNRIENTCSISYINKVKMKQCENAGYKYFQTSHLAYSPGLFLVEIFYPEEMLKRYKNPTYGNDLIFYKDTPGLEKTKIIQQLRKFASETTSKRNSHCYEDYKNKIFTLVDTFEYKFMYETRKQSEPISHKIKEVIYNLMKCLKKGWKKNLILDTTPK